MSANTGIEWTDRTWNPLTGCTKVSPGCDHCYAKTMHERFNGPGSFDTITLHPDRLGQPSRWRKPSRVFVNSMSDLFHQDVPEDYILAVFGLMAQADRHTFQVLTKRHARMRSLLTRWSAEVPWLERPLPNVWLGVSVENQRWADIRVPALLDTPASVRFLSCEPLLGPVTLHRALCSTPGRCYNHPQGSVDWVITGGESGPGARPANPNWFRSIRDQCQDTRVAYLHKQNGVYAWNSDETQPRRVGKKAAGRELDGRTWDEYPAAGSAREAVQA